MHPTYLRIPIALLAGVWLAAPAAAQLAPKPATPAKPVDETAKSEAISLSVFEVTTDQDIGYQSTNAAEATRMNTPIENIPMNVTVFNQQFIEDLIATDTSALLAYEPSAVKTSENDGFLARGSASVGANFLNGFAQTGGFGSQPLMNIERVEVLRGPAAVLYGSGGYGATFNRITKQPREKPFSSARVIASNYSSFRGEFDNTGPLPFLGGKTFAYRINGTYDRGYTWFKQRREEDGLAPTFSWKIGPKTKVIFEYLYNWRESQASWETPVHNGIPQGITTGDGVFREYDRSVAWVNPEDYRHNTRQVASYDLRHAFTDNLQFRSQFQYETKKQDNREAQALSDGVTILRDTALMPRLWRHIPRDTDNYRTRNELIWNTKTGPVKHRLLFGHGWIEQYDLNITYRSPRSNGGQTGANLTGNGRTTDANAGPLFNSYPNLTYAQFIADPTLAGFNRNNLLPYNLFNRGAEPPLPPESQRPGLYLDTETKTYIANQDLYFNDLLSFADDRFFVMVGGRYSEVKRRTQAFATGTFPNKVRNASPATVAVKTDASTGSVGLVYHLNSERTLTLYGNLNNSFNPEFRTQPDGEALDPEEGKQKEIGFRFSFLTGRLVGLVTYFDLLQDNVTRSDPNPGRTGYFLQESGQRSTGVEFSLNARMTSNWYVMGGFSDTDARNDITGVPKDLSPRYRFTMFNRYNFNQGKLKGLNLSLGTIYTDERPLTVSTTRNSPNWGPMPDYWRVDAIAGYKLKLKGSRVSYDLSLKINNLFDNQDIYYVGVNHRYTLDPGREWQAVLSARF
ncbi:MAG: TonB-dependent receptor [Opitutaceae bacterium]|nr:TonB-dependent receptor [Opitutaceae bacterium]